MILVTYIFKLLQTVHTILLFDIKIIQLIILNLLTLNQKQNKIFERK